MNKYDDADVIKVCSEEGDFLWLSEKAERRLGWILSGIMVLATLPVFIVAFLM